MGEIVRKIRTLDAEMKNKHTKKERQKERKKGRKKERKEKLPNRSDPFV